MVKKTLIKNTCAIVLVIVAIVIYITVHGTENLIISDFICSFIPNFPTIKPKILKNGFIKNHLVDIFWFLSFLLFFSTQTSKNYLFIVLLVAVFIEIMQFLFPIFGTFDLFDIFTYITIFFTYLILDKNNSAQ